MVGSIDSIRTAFENVSKHVHYTPLVSSRLIGDMAGVNLFLKCENLQKTGSFKVRGALNKIISEGRGNGSKGVVTVSAGNHAQALTYAAVTTDTPCTVVMPANATKAKVSACKAYGADVIFEINVHDAFDKALELSETEDMTFVSPFDDQFIIEGQGTVGLEIDEQLKDTKIDTAIVQIGGGGLISGVSSYLKQVRPDITIWGVEPEGANSMRLSFDAGKAMRIDAVTTIADGLGSPMAGDLTYEVCKKYIEDVIIITDDEIIEAMKLILSRAKLMCEPAGAASVAALLAGKVPVKKGENVVCILSGGNVDLDRLSEFITR